MNLVAAAILLLVSVPLAKGKRPIWIAWNIGQGSFTTLVQEHRCDHFDMGGEHLPKGFELVCRHRKQTASITHADGDHWKLIRQTRKYICLQWPIPVPLAISTKKMNSLRRLPRCSDDPMPSVKSWLAASPSQNAGSNEIGRWFEVWDQVLITGDSPQAIERRQNPSAKTRLLLLGHHGSRTSTSENLLARLTNLKIAISSARKAKYGHPHIDTIWKLRSHGVAILRTEDWGNIAMELSPSHKQKEAVLLRTTSSN